MSPERASARSFVALSLGPELGARVAGRVAGALDPADFRLPRAEGLHLTLFFLGEIERARLVPLADALRAALRGAPAPALRLCGTGAFPDPRRPRVLWVGVAERAAPGRLAACRAAVLAGLAREGIDTRAEQEEPFRPHVTVARPRGRARVPQRFAGLRLELDWSPDAVELLESSPDAQGSRYVALERFEFSPRA